MAIRKPLVIVAGQVQQLQAGDQLSAGVALADTRALTNGEAAASMPIGTPGYVSGAGAAKRAQANALATADVVGLVYDPAGIANGASGDFVVDGVVSATTAQWDAVTGQVGGLTPGSAYFLDPATPGKLTSTPPSAVGQVVTRVGIALSDTDFDVRIGEPILL